MKRDYDADFKPEYSDYDDPPSRREAVGSSSSGVGVYRHGNPGRWPGATP